MSQELDSDAGRWDAWHETLKVSICFQQGSEDLSPLGPSGLRGFGACFVQSEEGTVDNVHEEWLLAVVTWLTWLTSKRSFREQPGSFEV